MKKKKIEKKKPETEKKNHDQRYYNASWANPLRSYTYVNVARPVDGGEEGRGDGEVSRTLIL